MADLLKFITCGSVDDGKSTLIGHILYDAKLFYTDQKQALELDSKAGSREGKIDYSLLLDGLIAEREQGITIDVAYRYFTTDARSFIVADTPGHEEYTRNMAVGASFADLSVILIDASQGVLVQTRRHARICALMGIQYFVFAINKMDLVNYRKEPFDRIEQDILALQDELGLESIQVIPLSATEGDNVTKRSDKIAWYNGKTLMDYLETIDVAAPTNEKGFYLPVQRVCRPNHTFRGFQGQIESGKVRVGDEIVVLPSAEKAHVKSIHVTNQEVEEAFSGQPVTIQLNREVDVSRGCVLSSDSDLSPVKRFTTSLLWMDDAILSPNKDFLVKIGTKRFPGIVSGIKYKIDVNTGEHMPVTQLHKNEIAVCEITLTEKEVLDTFQNHKTMGELILIDRITNRTSACGVVEERLADEDQRTNHIFYLGELHARGDVFEEFYYNLESQNLEKKGIEKNTYTVGDEIPIKGASFHYPDNFDILFLCDQVAVQIRDRKVAAIQKLANYEHTGWPLVNGHGFGFKAKNHAEIAAFFRAYEALNDKQDADFYNNWIRFDTFRQISFVFHENDWII